MNIKRSVERREEVVELERVPEEHGRMVPRRVEVVVERYAKELEQQSQSAPGKPKPPAVEPLKPDWGKKKLRFKT